MTPDEKANLRKRLLAEIEFARTQPYTSQTALAEYLTSIGFPCNQSMVCKDLVRIGYAPYMGKDGKTYLGPRSRIIHKKMEERYAKLFNEAVVEAFVHNNNVILETLPGCGQAAATVIDACGWQDVIATTYGINSAVLITENTEIALSVLQRVKEGLT